MNNKIIVIGVIVVTAVILTIIGIQYSADNPSTLSTNNNTANPNNQQNSQIKGTMYVTITDAAANMGTISAVNMTIDDVQIYSNTQGWIDISTAPQTFNLLQLKADNQAMLLAKTDVLADTYNKIKFHISGVSVIEAGKTTETRLPSETFELAANTVVYPSANSTILIDVLADKSLHKTSKGEFVFAPVVKLNSTSNTTVNVAANNAITSIGGTLESNVNAGMDLDGSVKVDFVLNPEAKIEINGEVLKVNGAATNQIQINY